MECHAGKTLYIEPGSPWKNSYDESFNRKLRDELLNGETFYTMREADILIGHWRIHYNAFHQGDHHRRTIT